MNSQVHLKFYFQIDTVLCVRPELAFLELLVCVWASLELFCLNSRMSSPWGPLPGVQGSLDPPDKTGVPVTGLNPPDF